MLPRHRRGPPHINSTPPAPSLRYRRWVAVYSETVIKLSRYKPKAEDDPTGMVGVRIFQETPVVKNENPFPLPLYNPPFVRFRRVNGGGRRGPYYHAHCDYR